MPRPVAPASKPPNAKQPASKHVPAVEPAQAAKAKEEPKAEQKPSSKDTTPVPSGAKKPAPALKRGGSGGIMQSFAKAASKPKKEKTSQPATPSAAEDSSMQALSDDGEDDAAPVPEPMETEAAPKSRRDRKEELRRMMEEESDEEEPEKEDTPMEEPEEEAPAPEPEKQEAPEPAEVVSSTGDGRRRGKRRVMKKKTVMDEQGYLGKLLHLKFDTQDCILTLDTVTVQELGWESFSEDEPAPPPKKKAQPTAQPVKPKKPAAKGQGNIMSFFSKK